MSCQKKDVDLLMRHAAGQLGPEEQSRLEQHLRECAECRAMAAEQEAVWRALDEWPAAPVSATFDERLYARIAAEEAESWWQRLLAGVNRGLSWRAAFSLAGACAVIIAVLLMRGPLQNPGTTAAPPAVAAQKAVDIDQVESALDDVDMLNQLGAATPAPAAANGGSGS